MDLLQKLCTIGRKYKSGSSLQFTCIGVYYAPCFFWMAEELSKFVVAQLLKRVEGQTRLMEANEMQERQRE